MTEPTRLQETPAERQARIAQAAERTKQAVHANGVKAGRQAERKAILEQLGAQTIADASQIARLTAERDARVSQAEEAKHGRFRFYQGGFLGMIIGASLMLAAGALMVGEIFKQAGQYGREMAVTGAIAQGVNEPSPCVPGSTLPDGRVCPARQ